MERDTNKLPHTPGPWTISELNDAIDGEEDILIEHEGFPLCTVRGTNDMSCFDDDEQIEETNTMVIANAKLIASAPDMLLCLKNCLQVKSHKESVEAMKQMIRGVIKKATE